MPKITTLTGKDILAIEQALGFGLPRDYVRFVTKFPFPDLVYMRAEDLIALYEVRADLLIRVNENLRHTALNPLPWKEYYFAIGERAEDEAIFYLNSFIKDACPVFVQVPGEEEGVKIAESFTDWAAEQVRDLSKRDQNCMDWQKKRTPPWWWPWKWFA